MKPPRFSAAVWDIPLWTFSDHSMSLGTFDDGRRARVLIDSGNFAQTLLWPPWSQENIPNHPGASRSLIAYAFTDPRRRLKGLQLGGRTLPEWPVFDMPPVTLKNVDLLDVLMGHDLLSQYTVIVDLQNRRLRLISPGETFQPPIAKEPFTSAIMSGLKGKKVEKRE